MTYLDDAKARDAADAETFRTSNDDQCMLCRAEGQDKRSLYLNCLYDVKEVVEEFLSLREVPGEAVARRSFFYLRICKYCRARLLHFLRVWRDEAVARRNEPKDSDGTPEPREGADIPVRINGGIFMLTEQEYYAQRGPDAPPPVRPKKEPGSE